MFVVTATDVAGVFVLLVLALVHAQRFAFLPSFHSWKRIKNPVREDDGKNTKQLEAAGSKINYLTYLKSLSLLVSAQFLF